MVEFFSSTKYFFLYEKLETDSNFGYDNGMRRIYIVPNIITAFSLASGLFVIFKVNMVEPGMETYKSILTSTLILLLAAFADWVDGAVARAMHAESEFGVLFDSLADAVTFGVAPSVLMLKNLSLERGTPLSFYAMIGSMLFSICGILRLVRYNVMGAQIKKLPKHAQKKFRHFTGLPIPAAALTLVSTNLLFAYSRFEAWTNWSELTQVITTVTIAIFLGYLMVSQIKYPSAKMLHIRVPSFQLIPIGVFVAFFLIYGVLYFFPLALGLLTWFYVFLGLLLLIFRLFVGKKSKKFVDFEPNHDD